MHASCSGAMGRMIPCSFLLIQPVVFSFGGEETLNGGGFLFPLVLQMNKLSSQVWGFGAADQQCRCPGVGQRAGLWAKHPRNADVLLLGPGWGLEQFGGFCGVQSRSWMSCNRGPIPGAAGEQCAGMLWKLLPCSGVGACRVHQLRLSFSRPTSRLPSPEGVGCQAWDPAATALCWALPIFWWAERWTWLLTEQ